MAGGFLYLKSVNQLPPSAKENVSTAPPPISEEVDIRAKFTITTDKIIRNFSNPKYHNQSTDVFIQVDNPTVVYVKKSGITWSDFFKTLPMSLTKDCLTTGDGEKLCNDKGVLKFYLNDLEDPDVLDKDIKHEDALKVTYYTQ